MIWNKKVKLKDEDGKEWTFAVSTYAHTDTPENIAKQNWSVLVDELDSQGKKIDEFDFMFSRREDFIHYQTRPGKPVRLIINEMDKIAESGDEKW